MIGAQPRERWTPHPMKWSARKALILLVLSACAGASARPDDQGLAAVSAGETSNRLEAWFSGPIERVYRRMAWPRFLGGPCIEALLRRPAAEGLQLSSSCTAPTVEGLLNAADMALYRAKATGRNRVAEGAARQRDEAVLPGG
jgi:hypothetical protein